MLEEYAVIQGMLDEAAIRIKLIRNKLEKKSHYNIFQEITRLEKDIINIDFRIKNLENDKI